MDNKTTNYQVIIVGAGLAGLSAAKQLIEGDETGTRVNPHDILILEGLDRVGGRTKTKAFNGGKVLFDCGAGWVGDDQHDILKLVDELKLNKVRQKTPYSINLAYISQEGNRKCMTSLFKIFSFSLLTRKDKIGSKSEQLLQLQPQTRENISSLYNLTWKSYIQLGLAIMKIDWMLRQALEPNSKVAKRFGSKSVDEWITENVSTEEGVALLRSYVSTEVGVSTLKYPMIYFLRDLATYGSFANAQKNSGQYRIAEGTGSISAHLAENLRKAGVSIRLNTSVVKCNHDDSCVEIETQSGHCYISQRAIFAIPVTSYQYINFSPSLPQHVNATHMSSSKVIKVGLLYAEKWWKTDGAFVDPQCSIPATTILDISTEDCFVLAVLFVDDKAIALTGDKNKSKRENAAKYSVEQLLSPKKNAKILEPIGYAEGDWPSTPGIFGAYGIYPKDGIPIDRQKLGKQTRKLHFACSEIAHRDAGYMSGAVNSGKAEARELLRKIYSTLE